MEKINLSHTNEYYKLADMDAIEFLQAQYRLKVLRGELQELRVKYAHVLNRSIKMSLPKMLTVPAHLGAACLEGFVLAPLFKTVLEGYTTSTLLLNAVSFIPIGVFAGLSLAAGHTFQKVSWKADEIDPQRINKNSGALHSALGISVFYIFLIAALTFISQQMLGDESLYSYIILLIGIAELILGYFAIQGWECLHAYSAMFALDKQMRQEIKKINVSAHRCEQHYTFFTQGWAAYCLNQGLMEPPRINQRIRKTLDFCQIYDERGPDDQQLDLVEYDVLSGE